MSYIDENFLLYGETAKKLYFGYAATQPIFDYHCHLSEKQILENARFKDIAELWLGGDHYKWRLMRSCGVDERFITGDASGKEKFLAYCGAVESAFGNPLYQWSQLELEKCFGCTLEINTENVERIWQECNAVIERESLSPVKLIERANVRHVYTTNEIFDDLSVFGEIAAKGYGFTVTPALRADKIMNVEAADYNAQVDKLQALTSRIDSLDDLENAVKTRLDEFVKSGAKASDIALEKIYPIASRSVAADVFARRRAGKAIEKSDEEAFKGYFTRFLIGLYAERGVCVELHIGALRNVNSVAFRSLGADSGYDCVSDRDSASNLAKLFDSLSVESRLPKTVLFNLNPKLNVELTTLAGCFQSSEARGKIQYGPAWWFLDHKRGMERQLADLAATGHLGSFIGMLTDSRSFLSYSRHDYFRRVLCNVLGEASDRGEITSNVELIGETVKNICYFNAVRYFGEND